MRGAPLLRQSFRTVVTAATFLTLSLSATAQTGASVSEQAIANVPAHPRLLADTARWEALRELVKTDPVAKKMFAQLQAQAARALASPPIDFRPRGPREPILEPIRQAQICILSLAMVYRLTGDPALRDAAIRFLNELAAIDWPRSHFLTPSEACFAMSVGCDWLYDELTPAQRETYADKIRALLEVTVREEAAMSFLQADHNWNQVCNGGLVAGAIAIADRDPELARHVINRAIVSLPNAAASYAPDGIYPEGPNYWGYGTTFHISMIEALRTALGSSFGLETFPGFLATTDAMQQLDGPTGLPFNYADNKSQRHFEAPVIWFASELGRPELAENEVTLLEQPFSAPETQSAPKAQAANNSLGTRDLPLALLWHRPATNDTPGSAELPPLTWAGKGPQPIAVLRSAWNDPNATWIAIKGGTPVHSHAHMDIGTFVLEADGVRWAVDPARDEYSRVRLAGMTHGELFDYSQDSQRWDVFRLGPDGHNILRFNNQRQTVSGHAAFGEVQSSDAGSSIELDLSPVYADQARSVLRRVVLRPDRTLVITDEWTTNDRPADVSWQWLTQADVTIDGDAATLTQDGKTLRLRILDGATRFELQEADSLLDPKWDSPAPQFRRLVVRTTTPADTAARLEVQVTPGSADQKPR